MAFQSINPATGESLEIYPAWQGDKIEAGLKKAADVKQSWASLPLRDRCELLIKTAEVLKKQKDSYAKLITKEMGKLYTESQAEIEKCALGCEYYAQHAAEFLRDEYIETDAGKSYVAYQPIGTVLAVMPWNFPFWQVFRFAAPALAAGNTGILKHASNVPQCAMAIEAIFAQAGFPEGVFQAFMIGSSQVKTLIEDHRVAAVTLTGSEPAGRSVAAIAGDNIKKSVLELGGSDAFIVLQDANLVETVKNAVISRYLNGGQSCIAAKRFIVVDSMADKFIPAFKSAVENLKVGDPMNSNTTLAPMARVDLRDELHKQVSDSIEAGAVAVTGCEPVAGAGAFYQPSILDKVVPGIRAYEEELFGPVAIIIRAKDEDDAIRIANDSRFGLGGSVWTQDQARGEKVARQLQCGSAFVNSFVKSDPKLPFGGVKASGYGRELSHHGMHEFVNAKTIWIK